MKTNIYLLFLLLLPFCSCAQKSQNDDAYLIKEVARLTTYEHINPRALNDTLSVDFFEAFLDYLDKHKAYLLQQDVDELLAYQYELDEALTDGNTDFFEHSLDLLTKRVVQAEGYLNLLLDEEISMKRKDAIETDSEKIAYARTAGELKSRWEKRIAYRTLEAYYILNKKHPKTKKKELLAKAKEQTRDYYESKIHRLKTYSEEEWRTFYLNSFLSCNDVQSGFYPKEDKETWDANYTRSFVGVGLRLDVVDGYPVVQKVFIGGPAWKSQSVDKEDVVLEIKNEEGVFVDLHEQPLSTGIALLKGEKGSFVEMIVKRKNGAINTIKIERGNVGLEPALSLVLEPNDNGQRVAYVRLPRFYAGKNSSSTDVLAELEKIKNSCIDGIVFDLRNNQGGSSYEAIKMIGLFIESGAVMRLNRRDEEPQVRYDDDNEAQFRGEVVVLINERSASASELFSSNMKDYDRAVVVGTSSTFGKGTMQRFLPIEKMENGAVKDLGSIKMTVGFFASGSGFSSQYTGVAPDILLPHPNNYIVNGERKFKHAFLPENSELFPCSQSVNTNPNLEKVKAQCAVRLSKSKFFRNMEKVARDKELAMNQTRKPLNYKKIRAHLLQEHPDTKLKFTPKSYSITLHPQDEKKADAARKAHLEVLKKEIEKDAYVEECFWIVRDLIG